MVAAVTRLRLVDGELIVIGQAAMLPEIGGVLEIVRKGAVPAPPLTADELAAPERGGLGNARLAARHVIGRKVVDDAARVEAGPVRADAAVAAHGGELGVDGVRVEVG